MHWIVFGVIVIVLLYLDLAVFQKDSHQIKVKEALVWSAIWIFIALLFNVGIYFTEGKTAALQFLTGYLLEKSLSVDNLFVFLLIFSYFRVPDEFQHRVLFWGILGALVMRAIFIVAGITLIHYFEWMIYVFGIFLIFTGAKLFTEKDKEIHPEKSRVLKLFRKIMPVTESYEGKYFFIRRAGKRMATPLFAVLLMIETTDVIFAVDSIPAILGITTDPFIVYTSNIFAILGLRALYFALSGALRLFHHLHYGLAVILVFVGVKMMIAEFYHVPIGYALGGIAAILILSVLASILFPQKKILKPGEGSQSK